MALTKYKLGELLELLEETNFDLRYDLSYVRGVNNNKQLMPTKADMNGRDISKFQVVKPREFVFNHRTSRNGSKFSIAMNDEKDDVICTEDYVVFKIKECCKTTLIEEWLYLYFNRPEFDRYVITNSWGSSTEFYNWEDLCDIDIELPDLSTQQKYVDIYKAMFANQQSYERGLEDLKLVCDGYIEDIRRKMPCEKIGKHIEQRKEKNESGIETVLGISKEGFIDPKQDTGDLHNYWLFKKDDFVYSPPRINVGSIGIYKGDDFAVCSPIYVVFYVKRIEELLPDYLMMWLKRDEFLRSTDYFSLASVRNNFSFDLMSEVKIPIPSIEIQKDIVNIFKCYTERKEINEKLKAQIKDICPILIKGSLEADS